MHCWRWATRTGRWAFHDQLQIDELVQAVDRLDDDHDPDDEKERFRHGRVRSFPQTFLLVIKSRD